MASSSRGPRGSSIGPARESRIAPVPALTSGLVLLALALPRAGSAQEGPPPQPKWLQAEPRVTFETTLTDNADFDLPAESDLQFVVRPGLDLDIRGRTYTIAFDGAVGFLGSVADERLRLPSDLNLLSTSEARFFDDRLRIESASSVDRQPVSETAATSARTTGRRNTALVQRFTLTPTLETRLGDAARTRTELGISYLRSQASDSDSEDGTGGAAGGNTETRQATMGFSLLSGAMFRKLQWELSAVRETTEQEGVGAGQTPSLSPQRGTAGGGSASEIRTTTRTTLEASTEYAVTPWLFALANAGTEDIDDPGTTAKVSGLFWDLGGRIDGAKLDFTARFGHRYGGPTLSFIGTYSPNDRTFLSATFDRTLETEQQRQLRALQTLGVDAEGNIIDTRFPDLPLEQQEALYGLQDITRLRDSFGLRARTGNRRNTFDLSLVLDRSETTGATDLSQTTYSGRATWERRLSRRVRSRVGGDVRFTTSESTDLLGDTQTTTRRYTAYTSLIYELSSTLSGAVAYSFRSQTAEEGGGSILENAIVSSITKRF